MASGKMLSLSQTLSLVKNPMFWSIPQRNMSKRSAILKKLGLPELPKKPLNSYMSYCKAVRPRVVAQNPNITTKDVAKLIGRMWQQESQSEKEKYNRDAQAKMQVYKTELEKYNKNMKEETKQELKELMMGDEIKKNQQSFFRKLKEEEKMFKKPKSPPTGFVRFLQSVNALKRKELKEASEIWRSMSDHEKEKYKADYVKEKQKYDTDLLKWEEDMLRQGNIDLIGLQSIRKKLLSYAKQPNTER